MKPISIALLALWSWPALVSAQTPAPTGCAALANVFKPVADARARVAKLEGRYGAPRGTHFSHRGIDIFLKDGGGADADVSAVATGRVAFVGARKSDNADAGTLVVIEHPNECYSVYAYLDKLDGAVKPDAVVNGGARLGSLRKKSFDLDENGDADAARPTALRLHFGLFEAKAEHLKNATNKAKLLTCPLRWRDPVTVLPSLGYAEDDE